MIELGRVIVNPSSITCPSHSHSQSNIISSLASRVAQSAYFVLSFDERHLNGSEQRHGDAGNKRMMSSYYMQAAEAIPSRNSAGMELEWDCGRGWNCFELSTLFALSCYLHTHCPSTSTYYMCNCWPRLFYTSSLHCGLAGHWTVCLISRMHSHYDCHRDCAAGEF